MFTDKVDLKDFHKMDDEFKELWVKILTVQSDSELGGPHLYVKQWILAAPTAEDQMMLAKTAAEEFDHYRKFAKILNDLNIDVSEQLYRPSSERLIETFREPLSTWADMGWFGALIDRVGKYHLKDFEDCSYLPVSRIIPQILREELQHVAHGLNIIQRLVQTEQGKAAAQDSLNRMYPKGLDMFGVTGSKRSEKYVKWGIKKRTNEQARSEYKEIGRAHV